MHKDYYQEERILVNIYEISNKEKKIINDILKEENNKKLIKVLTKMKEEYQNISNEIINVLKKYQCNLSISNNKINDKSNILIIIQNHNQDIIDVIRYLNEYEIKEPPVVVLATKLKATLEKNISLLKTFL